MDTIWTLGIFAILTDGETFCVTRGNPEDFASAEILDVHPTPADARRSVAFHATVRAKANRQAAA